MRGQLHARGNLDVDPPVSAEVEADGDNEKRTGASAISEKFFILGCPRSGTTVLQQALNRHPSIVVPAETKLFYYFVGMSQRWQARHIERLNADLGLWIPMPKAKISTADQVRDFHETVAGQYVRTHCQSTPIYFGDKTPEHTSRIDMIRRVYPTCKLLCILRDPRAVSLSLTRVPWIRCTPLSAAMVWRRYANHLARWHQRQDANALFIYYEDLVQRPEPVLRRVCDFLAVDYASNMATGCGTPEILPSRELDWKAESIEPIGNDRVDHWRSQLSPNQLAKIERVCGRQMVNFGYQPENATVNRMTAVDFLQACIDVPRTLKSLTWQCVCSEMRYLLAAGLRFGRH